MTVSEEPQAHRVQIAKSKQPHRLQLEQRYLVSTVMRDGSCPIFQREVLDLLAHLVRCEAVVLPEFQALVNSIIAEAMDRNALPGRSDHRPPERVIDNERKLRAVKRYYQLVAEQKVKAKEPEFKAPRKKWTPESEAADAVAVEFSADKKSVRRWVRDAKLEYSRALSDFDAQAVADELGIDRSAMLPPGTAPGTQFILHVEEHAATGTRDGTGTPPTAPIGPDCTPLWVPIPPDVEP